MPFSLLASPRARLLLVLVFVFFGAVRLAANSDERTWIFADGETFRAELVRYDEAAGKVVLRFKEAAEREIPLDRFGTMDRAWLAEWAEMEDDLNALVAELGGKLAHLVTTGAHPTDLFVYTPSAALAADAPPPPALILFHPGGKAARYVKSHMEAAEKSGLLLVACGQFRNTGDAPELEAGMGERFREVFPQILARVRLDPARLFMGGTSGGAWRAYHYAAEIKHPWAGIYANGGWLGGKKILRPALPRAPCSHGQRQPRHRRQPLDRPRQRRPRPRRRPGRRVCLRRRPPGPAPAPPVHRLRVAARPRDGHARRALTAPARTPINPAAAPATKVARCASGGTRPAPEIFRPGLEETPYIFTNKAIAN